jgi:CheY-like chemotaxis protein
VLAFEDHYDIEAMLVAGGVNTDELTLEQRWNSSDALKHIERFAPDVLLLDHYMPPMSGYDVLRALLASDIKRPSNIVAMSSDATRNEAMMRIGADVGVVKFDISTLDLWLN